MKCPKCLTDNASEARYCQECATPLPAASGPGVAFTETMDNRSTELTMGSIFAGRYQIVEELGHGGMGRVFRALDTQLHEEVALKLIRPEIALDRDMLDRFRNELKLARKISHRNVGRMYELMDDRGAHFITMEYVPGEDLRSFIRRSGQLTVGKTMAIAAQVADGLEEAHRLGIIHRDLKPSNIIIDREGNAKIMDFGIARSLSAKRSTGVGVMIGTPEYMSPEQVEGRDVDPRSDLYSLGIILYEMLTGRVPFEGETPFEIGVKQKSERPKSPREFNASIPEEVNRLILKCLAKDKAARPRSAAELRTEFERIRQSLPTTEHPIPLRKSRVSREITVKFQAKRLILPAGVLVLAGVALIAWRLLVPGKTAPASDKPSLAIAYFENISEDSELNDWRTGVPELLTTDLSQSKYLSVLGGEAVYGLLKKNDLLEANKYTEADLLRLAEQGRVGYVLTGGIMKAGSKITITAHLYKPRTKEPAKSARIECDGEEDIPRKVDELTRMIKAELNLSPRQISDDIDKNIGQITTSSPEALKLYVEARKRQAAMQYAAAIPIYERAVALDPGFAMAYRGMATCYNNRGFIQKSREFNQKALDNAGRISDRERLLIQGRAYYLFERTYDKAIQTFEEMLRLYPDEYIALNGLGVVYANLEEDEKALAFYEKSYAIQRDNLNLTNVSSALQSLGRYEEARRICEEYLSGVSDNARIQVHLGRIALNQGRYPEAEKEAERAELLAPGDLDVAFLKSDLDYLRGRFEPAEKVLRAAIENNPPATIAFARIRLVLLFQVQGRFIAARDEFQRLVALTDELKVANLKASSLYFSSMLDANDGRPDLAQQKVDQAYLIFKEMDLWPRMRTTMTEKGILALAAGRPEEAAKISARVAGIYRKKPEPQSRPVRRSSRRPNRAGEEALSPGDQAL